MNPNILISDSQEFQRKLNLIISWGSQNFHVIADFDRTLTKAFVDWNFRASLESVLENWWYLWSDYSARSKANFDKYHPIEIDSTIPLEDKKSAMLERRTNQFQAMIECGLTKNIIQEAMKSDTIVFRNWHEEFFDILLEKDIPLIIFSASWLWYFAIHSLLQNDNKLNPNINIISNSFIRDENGKAIWIKKPTIHSFNKDETAVRDFPVYEKIKHRKNILLLWDSLGDVDMANWFDYENIIKIWFLNKEVDKNIEQYKNSFDAVIADDGDMDYINDLLRKV